MRRFVAATVALALLLLAAPAAAQQGPVLARSELDRALMTEISRVLRFLVGGSI